MQTTDDRQLSRTAGKQGRSGSKLLIAGAVGLALGIALMLVFSGYDIGFYIGVVVATLSALPLIAGGALVLTAAVGKRTSQRKPFA